MLRVGGWVPLVPHNNGILVNLCVFSLTAVDPDQSDSLTLCSVVTQSGPSRRIIVFLLACLYCVDSTCNLREGCFRIGTSRISDELPALRPDSNEMRFAGGLIRGRIRRRIVALVVVVLFSSSRNSFCAVFRA